VAGVEEAVELYELAASGDAAAWRERCTAYEAALGHFERGRWQEALVALDQAGRGGTSLSDGPSHALREHIQSLVQKPAERFDGVWAFERK